MPTIEVRPAIANDIPRLMAMEHDIATEVVWQTDLQNDNGQIRAQFREVHLPRAMRVVYPRPVHRLADEWTQRAALWVAVMDESLAGYISLTWGTESDILWVSDLVVDLPIRRHGAGTALMMAVQSWAIQNHCRRILLEIQTKNHPAIRLSQKLGYEFCGFNDRHFANHDIALLFAKNL